MGARRGETQNQRRKERGRKANSGSKKTHKRGEMGQFPTGYGQKVMIVAGEFVEEGPRSARVKREG